MCVLSFFIFAGKKGGHKGRVRTYTSPDEIDAQMKAEKERKKVGGVCTSKDFFNLVPHRVKCVCSSSLKYWSSSRNADLLLPKIIIPMERDFDSAGVLL